MRGERVNKSMERNIATSALTIGWMNVSDYHLIFGCNDSFLFPVKGVTQMEHMQMGETCLFHRPLYF